MIARRCLLGLLAAAALPAAADPPASAKRTLKVRLHKHDAKGKVVPAGNVKLHFTVAQIDVMTGAGGDASLKLAPGSYRLNTASGTICSFAFKMPADKDLSLDLLVVKGEAGCKPHAAGGAAIAETAAVAAPRPVPRNGRS